LSLFLNDRQSASSVGEAEKNRFAHAVHMRYNKTVQDATNVVSIRVGSIWGFVFSTGDATRESGFRIPHLSSELFVDLV